MTLPPFRLFARKGHNVRHGHYFSLRVSYGDHVQGRDLSHEFARIRMERDGWGVFADREDEKHAYRAAVYRAGRNATLAKLLGEMRRTFVEIETENYHQHQELDYYDPDAAHERWLENGGPHAAAIQAEDEYERELEANDPWLQMLREGREAREHDDYAAEKALEDQAERAFIANGYHHLD